MQAWDRSQCRHTLRQTFQMVCRSALVGHTNEQLAKEVFLVMLICVGAPMLPAHVHLKVASWWHCGLDSRPCTRTLELSTTTAQLLASEASKSRLTDYHLDVMRCGTPVLWLHVIGHLHVFERSFLKAWSAALLAQLTQRLCFVQQCGEGIARAVLHNYAASQGNAVICCFTSLYNSFVYPVKGSFQTYLW